MVDGVLFVSAVSSLFVGKVGVLQPFAVAAFILPQ